MQLEKSSLNNLINNLCENCILLCFKILVSFGCYYHILDQDHNTLASIVCFKKLFIFCFENYCQEQEQLGEIHLFHLQSIIVFHLFFPPPHTPIMMTTIVVKLQLWREFFNYITESLWKSIKTNSSSKAMIGDTMIINSIVMIICMSHFTNHLWDLDLVSKILTFKTFLFESTTHAYLYEVIWPWEWLWLELPSPTNHNANMHNLDLACFYLQFDQRCHTYWTPLLLHTQHF